MSERIGPHVFTPKEMLVCTGCSKLNCRLVRSGRDPQWEYTCKHPKAPLALDGTHEGWIGELQETPQWCPELKANKPGSTSPLPNLTDPAVLYDWNHKLK